VIGDIVDVLEAWERAAPEIIATIIISYLIGGAYYVWSDLANPATTSQATSVLGAGPPLCMLSLLGCVVAYGC
jgi:hypothetical protein